MTHEDDAPESDEPAEAMTCPFCLQEGDACEHYLGSRDSHFGGGFGVDEGGPLADLSAVFDHLDQAVTDFLTRAGRTRVATLRPPRLRRLLSAISKRTPVRDGAVERNEYVDRPAFSDYLQRVLKDSGVGVRVTSIADTCSPGLSSRIDLYWVAGATAAVGGVRELVVQDTVSLNAAAG